MLTVFRSCWPIVCFFLVTSTSLMATERVYRYVDKDGTVSFSDIEPLNRYYEEVNFGCYACNLTTQVDWLETKLYLDEYQTEIKQAAKLYKVQPHLIRAIIHAESHFRHEAVSKQGAQGLMQLMPNTAKSLGVVDPFHPQQNIYGGVKHLAKLMKKYVGDIRMVAAAYNAGEGSVRKYGGVPPFPETKVYIERVAILHKRYAKALKA